MSGYAYDNRHETATVQHDALSRMLDPGSRASLTRLVPDLTGRRCLVVGAGSGSFPGWLASRAASVVATDIDTSRIADRAGVTVVRHDITTGPPPGAPYDVICARLLLMHLPSRLDVLARLADALDPGGVLLVEDWRLDPQDAVLYAPTPRLTDVYRRYVTAVVDILAGHGTRPAWAAETHAAMRNVGLVGVTTRIDAPVWTAGSDGLRLAAVTLAQLRDRLLTWGLGEEDLADIAHLTADPDAGLVVRGHQLYSNGGFRATGA